MSATKKKKNADLFLIHPLLKKKSRFIFRTEKINNVAKSRGTRCFSKDSNILKSAKMYNKYKSENVTVFLW